MRITHARNEDAIEILDLLAQRGWDEQFDFERGTIFIAGDQEVVGCLQITALDDAIAVLDLLLVDKQRRREGIGTALVRSALTEYPQEIYVSCRQDAVRFYERFEFTLLAGGVDQAPQPVRRVWLDGGNRAPLAMIKKRS